MTAARAYRHRKLLPYAAACVALVTLGACTSSDPGPGTTTPAVTSTTATTATTTTAAPTATTTPTPTATVDPVTAKIPAPARTNDREGAVAFARFYFSVLNSAFRTNKTDLLAALGTDTCITCDAFVQGVEQMRAKGQRYGGDLVKVSGASPIAFDAKAKRLLVEIDQVAVPVLDEA